MERKDGAMESRKAGERRYLEQVILAVGRKAAGKDMSRDWKLLFPELGLHRLSLGRHPSACQH